MALKLRFPLRVTRSVSIPSPLPSSRLPSTCTRQRLIQELNVGQIHEEFQGLVKAAASHESSVPSSANFQRASASEQLSFNTQRI